MREIFSKFCEAEFRADWDATIASHGDKACAALMPRTAPQRRADALVAIFEAAAAGGGWRSAYRHCRQPVDGPRSARAVRARADRRKSGHDRSGNRSRSSLRDDRWHSRRSAAGGCTGVHRARPPGGDQRRQRRRRRRPPATAVHRPVARGAAGDRTPMYVARMHDPSGHLPDRSPPLPRQRRSHRRRQRSGDVPAPQPVQVPQRLRRPPPRSAPGTSPAPTARGDNRQTPPSSSSRQATLPFLLEVIQDSCRDTDWRWMNDHHDGQPPRQTRPPDDDRRPGRHDRGRLLGAGVLAGDSARSQSMWHVRRCL